MYFRAEQMFLLTLLSPSYVTVKDGIQPATPAFFRLEMSLAFSLLFLASYDKSADVSLEASQVRRNL